MTDLRAAAVLLAFLGAAGCRASAARIDEASLERGRVQLRVEALTTSSTALPAGRTHRRWRRPRSSRGSRT